MRRTILFLELVLLFVGIPVAVEARLIPRRPIVYLLIAALGAWLILRRDPTFKKRPERVSHYLPGMAMRFLVLGAVLVGFTVQWHGDRLFELALNKPGVYIAVLLLYPVLSVLPQELLYRTYFFHRYRSLFPAAWSCVLASAATFAAGHIVVGTTLSIAFSFIGGLLFASTYLRSGSLLLVTIEHALYGLLIFTIGLGRFFYHGARDLGG